MERDALCDILQRIILCDYLGACNSTNRRWAPAPEAAHSINREKPEVFNRIAFEFIRALANSGKKIVVLII